MLAGRLAGYLLVAVEPETSANAPSLIWLQDLVAAFATPSDVGTQADALRDRGPDGAAGKWGRRLDG